MAKPVSKVGEISTHSSISINCQIQRMFGSLSSRFFLAVQAQPSGAGLRVDTSRNPESYPIV